MSRKRSIDEITSNDNDEIDDKVDKYDDKGDDKDDKVEVEVESVDESTESNDDNDDNTHIITNHTSSSSSSSSIRRKCPYLDTINRQKLDFDQQRICSITLSNLNIYACLICGKFFQGRGKSTHAYIHSVQANHFVFMQLNNGEAYCLPDNYEIIDAALNDVKRCLDPQYSPESVAALNTNTTLARDVYGVNYLPGFIGLNNLKKTDYLNAVLHALSHVTPLRDFFLLPQNYQLAVDKRTSQSPLLQHFGQVMRKLWSRDNFKSVISPQDFMHTISTISNRRFTIGQQAEAIDLFVWLLNELHRGLITGGVSTKPVAAGAASSTTKGKKSSIIHDTFQGSVEVTTLTRGTPTTTTTSAGTSESRVIKDPSTGETWTETKSTAPFTYLSLDIPPTPLFRDSQGGLIIPQIPLFQILKKFDGATWTDKTTGTQGGLVRKQYKIKSLPKYLVLHLDRFTRNNFTDEKNATIVTFPIKNLEMKPYLKSDEDDESSDDDAESGGMVIDEDAEMPTSVDGMSIHQLKLFVDDYGTEEEADQITSIREKADLEQLAKSIIVRKQRERAAKEQRRRERQRLKFLRQQSGASSTVSTKYNLVANICHDTLTAQSITSGLTTESSHRKPPAPPSATSVSAAGASAGNDSALPTAAALVAGGVLSNGCYRVHINNKATGQWFEIQDLHVSETMPQLVGVSESYMLVYERQE